MRTKNKDLIPRRTIRIRSVIIVSLILAVLIVLAYCGYLNEQRSEMRKRALLMDEYAALLDVDMKEILKDESLKAYGLKDIAWEVTCIDKDATTVGRYILSVKVDCTGTTPGEKDIAGYYYAIGSHIPGTGFAEEPLELTASTGDILTVYNTDERSEYWGKRMIYLNVGGTAIVKPEYVDPLKGADLQGMKFLKRKEDK